MALTLRVYANYESGTFGAFATTKNSPTIVTNPPPTYRYETYTAACLADINAKSFTTHSFPMADNKYVIGFPVRFSNVGATTSVFASIQSTPTDFHLALARNAGKLEIRDADLNVVATSAVAVFRDNTDHLVEVLFTFGDPGDVVVHVGGVEAVTASGEKFDSGTGTVLELHLTGQGGPPPSATGTYFPGGPYVYSGGSSVADFVGSYGSLTYRHDEASAEPDIGDPFDNGTWEDAVDFNDATYGEYTTVGDEGVVTTDYGGGSAIPGPYGDDRIGPNDEILGASWLVRRGTNTFILHYGKTPYDEPNTDYTSEINLGSVGVITSHLIVSEAAGDVPTVDEYFQHGCESVAPGGFPPSIKQYGCLCSLFLKVGARGITLGGGYGSRGKDILVG